MKSSWSYCWYVAPDQMTRITKVQPMEVQHADHVTEYIMRCQSNVWMCSSIVNNLFITWHTHLKGLKINNLRTALKYLYSTFFTLNIATSSNTKTKRRFIDTGVSHINTLNEALYHRYSQLFKQMLILSHYLSEVGKFSDTISLFFSV